MAAAAALVGSTPTLHWSPAASVPSLAGSTSYISDILERRQLAERSTSSSSYPAGSLQRRKFFCRTGFFLQIWPDGTVNTTTRPDSKFSILEFLTTMTFISNVSTTLGLFPSRSFTQTKVSIRGGEAKMWLCMNSSGSLYASRAKTSECEFLKEGVQRRRLRINWGVYYSTKYPARKGERWYIAFDKWTGRPLDAMSKIKKTSKCATRGIGDTSPIPVIRMPEGSSPLFSTVDPERTNSELNSAEFTRTSHRKSYTRKSKTYTRKTRHRNRTRKKRPEQVALSSLESILLDSSDFTIGFDSLLADWERSLSEESTENVRHSSSRSSSRRKTYTRLQSEESAHSTTDT